LRLARGVESLPASFRALQADFFRRAQQSDGGFAGRAGGSDFYYTGFGLRSMAILGQLEGTPADRAAEFLRSRLTEQVPVVDFLSLVYGAALLEAASGIDAFANQPKDWRFKVTQALESLRRDDGGYAKAAEGHVSSTYHSFLVRLAYQLLDQPVPEPQRLVNFVLNSQREDGGFVEIRVSRRSGTNPTAAAVGLLRICSADACNGHPLETIRDNAINFLVEMQTDEGGLRANSRIPIADILSTFTGILTLQDLGGLEKINVAAAREFVESLMVESGGFLAAAWDDTVDVEYSFYGLGALALLTR